MDEEVALLSELMLQTEVFCARLEAGMVDIPNSDDKIEFRLRLSQCRGILSQLQQLYDDDKLTVDHPLTAATFRQLVMSLLWVSFRGRELVDYKLYRKVVQIESGFTHLLISRQPKND